MDLGGAPYKYKYIHVFYAHAIEKVLRYIRKCTQSCIARIQYVKNIYIVKYVNIYIVKYIQNICKYVYICVVKYIHIYI